MKQTQFDTIEPNSSHDTITRISKDRIKKCHKPDCSKMTSLFVPSLRITYFCANQERVNRRIKELRKERPGIEIVIKKSLK
jgi:hypothetical protein